MRLLRAPIVATGVLALVVAGALAERDEDRPAKVVVGLRTVDTTIVTGTTVLVLPPVTTTAAPSTTTTTTAPIVMGDDDPEAIDGRTWTWDQLADCESGAWGANRVPIPGTARWAVTRSIYQGGLQFAAGTWDSYKEPGFPADAHLASREQQIVVAEKVIMRQGPRAWPTCAPRLGMIGTDLPLDAPITPSVPLAEALPS